MTDDEIRSILDDAAHKERGVPQANEMLRVLEAAADLICRVKAARAERDVAVAQLAALWVQAELLAAARAAVATGALDRVLADTKAAADAHTHAAEERGARWMFSAACDDVAESDGYTDAFEGIHALDPAEVCREARKTKPCSR